MYNIRDIRNYIESKLIFESKNYLGKYYIGAFIDYQYTEQLNNTILYEVIKSLLQKCTYLLPGSITLIDSQGVSTPSQDIELIKNPIYLFPQIFISGWFKSDGIYELYQNVVDISQINSNSISFGYDLFLTHEYLYYNPETMEYSDTPSNHYNPDWKENKQRIEEIVTTFDSIMKEYGFTKVEKE